jgi:IMP dehydrogenase
MEVHARRQDLTMLRQDVLGNYSSALTRTIKRPIYIIADGGIKSAGDIVKALCFSDMVMVGNLFAGCDEAPGHAVHIDGRKYKEYVGSSTHKTNHIEGVAAMVECKGPFKDILTKLTEGLRSGCSYQGVHNLVDLKRSPEFIRISNAGLVESHPHDVKLK